MSAHPANGPAPGADPRRALGALGEDLAAAHMIRRGYQIIERNFRTRFGELDIIAADERSLVFCEVKTRIHRGGEWRDPLEAVHAHKQRQIRKMAGQWLSQRHSRPRTAECRFDAIGVTVDDEGRLLRLDHLEAAF